jgi:hypothetical protein
MNKTTGIYLIFFIVFITLLCSCVTLEKFRGRGTGWGGRRANWWRLGAPIYGPPGYYGYPYPIISPYPGERLVPPYCSCSDPICDCSGKAKDF